MKSKFKNNPVSIAIKFYLLVIGVFTIFRIILFLTEINQNNIADEKIATMLNAFIMGIRFDIVIAGYILFLPLFILFLLDIFKKKNKIVLKIIFIYVFSFFTIAFTISAIDIPYFNQFFSRFSVGAFEWMNTPGFVFKMIFQEPRYFLFSIPLLILLFLFYIFLRKTIRQIEVSELNIWAKIPLYLLVLSFMFLGIRGRIAKKSPIRIGTAYFCNNPFYNQLGLNPVFTFMRSYLDSRDTRNKPINLMDSGLAVKNVQHYLGITKQNYKSPIARFVKYDSLSPEKYNIVIVIMESMSAAKMSRYGNKNNLTPFLDSLSYKSIYFDNIYTAGEHTFNGIFSTLFSFPALYRQHPMKQMHKYNGISQTLKKAGYQTIFFIPHDGQFDNVEGFLKDNDFQQVISQKDYPDKEVKTTLGVPDDYMFRFSIPVLNKLSKKSSPFLSVFMTASDHGPYYIPDYFTPKNKNIKQQIVEYSDWSLRQFITIASKQKWFDNTIFVFIADHGAALSVHYDIALNYHHSPLIIYAPAIFDSTKTIEKIGGQIDIFPTIMGILHQPYLNNTMGIDLLNESRPYIIINGDDKIGVLDNQFLLIFEKNSPEKLYKYRTLDVNNYFEKYRNKAKDMETYAKSMMQVYQDMISRNEISIN